MDKTDQHAKASLLANEIVNSALIKREIADKILNFAAAYVESLIGPDDFDPDKPDSEEVIARNKLREEIRTKLNE